jgi:putative transposase
LKDAPGFVRRWCNLFTFLVNVNNNMQYYQPLLPDHTYHLFSRAVGNEPLFVVDDNYHFFLRKLKQHTDPVCRLYCYSLLPNHFHLLVKIRGEEEIIQHFETIKKQTYQPMQHHLPDFIMERFGNLLNSYSKAFNKLYKRKGSLFMDYMRRSVVKEEADFTSYVWYIHKNAVHHHLARRVGAWKYDSYQSIISDAPTLLLRDELIEWFGNKNEFIKFHQQEVWSRRFELE